MFETLREEINTVLDRDPAAKSKLEVLLFYPGVHAMLLHRPAHYLWERNWRNFARFIGFVSRFITGIEIHPGASIGKHFFIDHGMGVVIGETATIGNNVTLYHGVTLGGTSLQDEIRHPQLGNDVIVGAGAQLLGPIKVGDGARIGSNAVVLSDVAKETTMVGIPAKRVETKSKAVSSEEHFDAYGVREGKVDDPVMRTLQRLEKEVASLQDQVAKTTTKKQKKEV